MSLIIPANSASASGGYAVDNSVRLNDGSSDSLNKTFGTPTNNLIWSFSTWVKRSSLGTQNIFSAWTDGNNFGMISFNTNDVIDVASYIGGWEMRYTSNRKFRDTSAWYHIFVSNDSSLASPETKIYINGVLETSFSESNAASQNEESYINKSGVAHWVGQNGNNQSYVDGYLAETVFLDGTAAAVTDFGEFDEDSGIFKPIDVSGLTFGNNGFYLDFKNSGALGADVSGNTNNFTVNNLTAIDQSTDTCTNNFATLNPLNYSSVSKTYSFGNTAITASDSNSWNATLSTFAVSSGKWYTEYKITAVGSYSAIGVGYQPFTFNASAYLGSTFLIGEDTGAFGWRNNGATKSNNANGTLSSWTTNDILMIAIDMDNEKLYVGKNGTWENSGNPESGSTGTGSVKDLTAGEDYLFVICPRGGGTSVNFGSPSFAISSGNTDGDGYGNFEYAVPSGYFSLNTKNLAEFG